MARSLVLSTLCGMLLTVLFWTKLWQGGGFIGGDTYTYFLPQKAFFADRLRSGEFPFWNYLVGHGYPILGESQTAALYPLNPLLYATLDLNTAYVASHLFHYVLAFVGCWLLAERMGLNSWGALLAGLVYVYGWFPPRACLEWAIIGGAYLPLTWWCLESWFQTRSVRYLAGLSLLLALDLLAGHYNLAFITTVALAAYLLLRAWLVGTNLLPGPADEPLWRRVLLPGLGLLLGFGLAAPQLAPSWSLKQYSQRLGANPEFDPAYGHIPPLYLSQTVAPWLWFGAGQDPDRALNGLTMGRISAATNKVEAHLYFGLLPFVLAAWWFIHSLCAGETVDRRLLIVAGLGLFGVVYATGWLLPVAEQLPGFGYFRGPGRWGILAQLAVALLAGRVLTNWTQSVPAQMKRGLFTRRTLLALSVLCLTAFDLLWISRQQWYTFTVSDPVINHRHESAIARLLRAKDQTSPPRLLAPGPNLASLTGAAVTPPYLGFGPDAYYLPGGRLPDVRFLQFLSGALAPVGVDVAAQFDWLRAAGVTHILSMNRLPYSLPVWREWVGYDPLLHPAWARDPNVPLRLYSINDAPGRLYLRASNAVANPPHDAEDDEDSTPVPAATARLTHYSANRVVAEVRCQEPVEVVLADLPWPEWELTVNGVATPAAPSQPSPPGDPADGHPQVTVVRRVPVPAGEHRLQWRYRPRSLWLGCGIAAASAVALLLLVRWARRFPARRDV